MNSTIWNGLKNYISPVSEDACNDFCIKWSTQIFNCSNIETRQWVHLQQMGTGVLGIATIAVCGLMTIYLLNQLNQIRNPRLVQVVNHVQNDVGEVNRIQQLVNDRTEI